MGTKQMRVSEELYARVKAENRKGETLAETLDRLVGGQSLRDLRDVFDEDEVNEMREAIDDADQRDQAELEKVAERFE